MDVVSPALMVARLHGVLVHRPTSRVVHVFTGQVTTSGHYGRRRQPVLCSARIGRVHVVARDGGVYDLDGRRVCGNCSARLSAVARRAEQPPLNRDRAVEFWKTAQVSLGDFMAAVAVAGSVAETHAIGLALGQVFPPPPARRPGADRAGWQALYDTHQVLLRRRTQLRAIERTPEDVEAAARAREAEAQRDALILAGRKKSDRVARAVDRRNTGRYLTPWERALADSA